MCVHMRVRSWPCIVFNAKGEKGRERERGDERQVSNTREWCCVKVFSNVIF